MILLLRTQLGRHRFGSYLNKVSKRPMPLNLGGRFKLFRPQSLVHRRLAIKKLDPFFRVDRVSKLAEGNSTMLISRVLMPVFSRVVLTKKFWHWLRFHESNRFHQGSPPQVFDLKPLHSIQHSQIAWPVLAMCSF